MHEATCKIFINDFAVIKLNVAPCFLHDSGSKLYSGSKFQSGLKTENILIRNELHHASDKIRSWVNCGYQLDPNSCEHSLSLDCFNPGSNSSRRTSAMFIMVGLQKFCDHNIHKDHKVQVATNPLQQTPCNRIQQADIRMPSHGLHRGGGISIIEGGPTHSYIRVLHY